MSGLLLIFDFSLVPRPISNSLPLFNFTLLSFPTFHYFKGPSKIVCSKTRAPYFFPDSFRWKFQNRVSLCIMSGMFILLILYSELGSLTINEKYCCELMHNIWNVVMYICIQSLPLYSHIAATISKMWVTSENHKFQNSPVNRKSLNSFSFPDKSYCSSMLKVQPQGFFFKKKHSYNGSHALLKCWTYFKLSAELFTIFSSVLKKKRVVFLLDPWNAADFTCRYCIRL